MLYSEVFMKVARWWLILLLCFIPFEFYIYKGVALWSKSLSEGIRRLDLITIIVLFPVSLIELYKSKRGLKGPYMVLLVSLIIMSITGLISGIMNGNSLFVTFHGIFQYLKYFLVIFIFSAFFRNLDELKKVYRYVLIIALFLAIAALIQELYADISRYIFHKNINDMSIYLFQRMRPDGILGSFWRFGFYRVSPFMNSSIIFGLYIVLILSIYIFVERKIKWSVVFLIALVSVLTFSKIVYFCMALLFVSRYIMGRKWMIIGLMALAVIPIYFSSFDNVNIGKFKDNIFTLKEYERSANNDIYDAFRSSARNKAIDIWKDHPLLGVGPGMFGGVVSVKYQSPVYEEYNLSLTNQHVGRVWGIDQFWFQVLAETGFAGISVFAALLFSLYFILHYSVYKSASNELKGLFRGLKICTIFIPIYAFGATLNITAFLFTYSAFIGMGLGYISSNEMKE